MPNSVLYASYVLVKNGIQAIVQTDGGNVDENSTFALFFTDDTYFEHTVTTQGGMATTIFTFDEIQAKGIPDDEGPSMCMYYSEIYAPGTVQLDPISEVLGFMGTDSITNEEITLKFGSSYGYVPSGDLIVELSSDSKSATTAGTVVDKIFTLKKSDVPQGFGGKFVRVKPIEFHSSRPTYNMAGLLPNGIVQDFFLFGPTIKLDTSNKIIFDEVEGAVRYEVYRNGTKIADVT